NRIMELLFQQLAGYLLKPVGRDADAALFQLQQLDRLSFLASAQDEADGGLLLWLRIVPCEPTQVELHLPLVGRLEIPELELNRDEAPQPAMVEEQVDIVVVSVNGDALLPRDEGESDAELQNEALQLPDDGVLEVLLQVPIREPEEIQNVGIAEDEVRSQP